MFQDVKTSPIICTPRSGPTDITFKYLDMRKFFGFERAFLPYYFKREGAGHCVGRQNLQLKIAESLSREHFILDFVS